MNSTEFAYHAPQLRILESGTGHRGASMIKTVGRDSREPQLYSQDRIRTSIRCEHSWWYLFCLPTMSARVAEDDDDSDVIAQCCGNWEVSHGSCQDCVIYTWRRDPINSCDRVMNSWLLKGDLSWLWLCRTNQSVRSIYFQKRVNAFFLAVVVTRWRHYVDDRRVSAWVMDRYLENFISGGQA